MILQHHLHQNYFLFSKNIKFSHSQTNRQASTDDEHQFKSFIPYHQIYFQKKDQSNQAPINQIKIRYKTQMCKNYSEMGYCNYRNKCQYAHGSDQLTYAKGIANKSYRTKNCKSFWQNGVCSYGIRCQFSHYTISLQTRLFLKMKQYLMNGEDIQQGESNLMRILKRNE